MRQIGGEKAREEKELQRENKVLWSGTSFLCQTIMHATGTEDKGKRAYRPGEDNEEEDNGKRRKSH